MVSLLWRRWTKIITERSFLLKWDNRGFSLSASRNFTTVWRLLGTCLCQLFSSAFRLLKLFVCPEMDLVNLAFKSWGFSLGREGQSVEGMKANLKLYFAENFKCVQKKYLLCSKKKKKKSCIRSMINNSSSYLKNKSKPKHWEFYLALLWFGPGPQLSAHPAAFSPFPAAEGESQKIKSKRTYGLRWSWFNKGRCGVSYRRLMPRQCQDSG